MEHTSLFFFFLLSLLFSFIETQTADVLKEKLSVVQGEVSPLALTNNSTRDVQLILDESMLKEERGKRREREEREEMHTGASFHLLTFFVNFFHFF